MVANLSITLIQTPLHWEDRGANIKMLDELLANNALGNLVVLPEMFTTGFTMNAAAVAEPIDGPTMDWLKQNAIEYNVHLTGRFLAKESGKYYNRMILMKPDGSYDQYDKRHLFRMANEHEYYSGGTKKAVSDVAGWKVCLQICYDLRFPVWARNMDREYDCLIYVANWPQPRRNAWNDLLKARAHENQAYVVGVNRTGTDGNDIAYSGDSTVIDPKGNYLVEPLQESTIIQTVELDYEELQQFREKFPVHLDADQFDIRI